MISKDIICLLYQILRSSTSDKKETYTAQMAQIENAFEERARTLQNTFASFIWSAGMSNGTLRGFSTLA